MTILDEVNDWASNYSPTEKQVEIAQKRAEVCQSCQYCALSNNKNVCARLSGVPLLGLMYMNRRDLCPSGLFNSVDDGYFPFTPPTPLVPQ